MKQPEVLYCHRCGKRARRSGGLCWYCNAELVREIRPPRGCPFCGEEIAHLAVKCPHCGEFLDGRAKPEGISGQQVTFVIDKAIFGSPNALGNNSGMPIVGSNQTLTVPSGNPPVFNGAALPGSNPSPLSLGQSNPGALGDESVAGALPAPVPSNGNTALVRQTNLVRSADLGSQGNGLVVRQDAASTLVQARVLEAESPAVSEKESAASPAQEPPSRYKICVNCQTELLAGDNYCFHCGALTQGGKPLKPLKLVDTKSNAPYFFFSMLCMFALVLHAWLRALKLELPASWGIKPEYISVAIFGCIGTAFLLLLIAFFRKRGLGNQILCMLLLVLWFLLSALALFFDSLSKLLSW
jgi:hypothetical protein